MVKHRSAWCIRSGRQIHACLDPDCMSAEHSMPKLPPFHSLLQDLDFMAPARPSHPCCTCSLTAPHHRAHALQSNSSCRALAEGLRLAGGFLVGGAAGNLQLTVPTAFTVAMWSWGVLTFTEGYRKSGSTSDALDNIKWGADWLVKVSCPSHAPARHRPLLSCCRSTSQNTIDQCSAACMSVYRTLLL